MIDSNNPTRSFKVSFTKLKNFIIFNMRNEVPNKLRAFLLLTFASVSMTVGNKYLMSTPLQNFKIITMIVQNGIAVFVMSTLMLFKLTTMVRITRSQMTYFTYDSLILVIQLWTSFEALQRCPVSTSTVFRALGIPCVAILEFFLLGKKLSMNQVFFCLLIVTGSFIYALEDWELNRVGYCWSGCNMLTCSINAIVDKYFFSNSEQTSSGCTLLTLLLSVPISIIHNKYVQSDGNGGDDFGEVWQVMLRQDRTTTLVLSLTGAIASLLGFCYTQAYRAASATTVAVAGNVNKLLSILVGSFLFAETLSLAKVCGIGVCLSGAFLYSQVEVRNKKAVDDQIEHYVKDKEEKNRGYCSVCKVEFSLVTEGLVRKHKSGPVSGRLRQRGGGKQGGGGGSGKYCSGGGAPPCAPPW